MPEIRKPTNSINISTGEQVTSTREGGLINRPTWTPDEGVARAKEIAEARAKAMEEYEAQQAASHPHRVLMDALAVRLTALEMEVAELKNAQKA